MRECLGFRVPPNFTQRAKSIFASSKLKNDEPIPVNKVKVNETFRAYTDPLIGSNIHTSVYDKRDDFEFPITNSPWLSGDVPRLPSYGIIRYIHLALSLICWMLY